MFQCLPGRNPSRTFFLFAILRLVSATKGTLLELLAALLTETEIADSAAKGVAELVHGDGNLRSFNHLRSLLSCPALNQRRKRTKVEKLQWFERVRVVESIVRIILIGLTETSDTNY